MKVVIDRVKSEQLPGKVMVGGAPVSHTFAEKIGVDRYAKNAAEAVVAAKQLIGVNV